MADKLHKKCLAYQKAQLRPPPEDLVLRWARQLKLSQSDAADISSKLELRHITGVYNPLQKNLIRNYTHTSSRGRKWYATQHKKVEKNYTISVPLSIHHPW